MNYIPQANSVIALSLYWVPMGLCLYGYLRRTVMNYRRDVLARAEAEAKERYGFYSPTDTLGTIVGRILVTVLPIANLVVAMFDLAPEVFGQFFEWIGRVFSKPLVPKRKDAN